MAICPQCRAEVDMMAQACECGYRFGEPGGPVTGRKARKRVRTQGGIGDADRRWFADLCILVGGWLALVGAVVALVTWCVLAFLFLAMLLRGKVEDEYILPLLVLPFTFIASMGFYYLCARVIILTNEVAALRLSLTKLKDQAS